MYHHLSLFFFKEFSANCENFSPSLPPSPTLISLLSLPLSLFPGNDDDAAVSLAPTARAVDRLSWQPSDESTVAQGGWTAGRRAWTDRAEVSARADAKPSVFVYVLVPSTAILSVGSIGSSVRSSRFNSRLSLSPRPAIAPEEISRHFRPRYVVPWCLCLVSGPSRIPEGTLSQRGRS